VNAKLRARLFLISQPAPSVGRPAGGYRRLSQVRLGRGGGGYSQLRSSIGALTPVSVGGASCRERPTGSRRCRRAAACLSDPASSPPHQRARAEEAREVTRPLMLTRSLTRRGVTGRRPEAVRAGWSHGQGDDKRARRTPAAAARPHTHAACTLDHYGLVGRVE
jgi:hypothetical protein